MESNEQPTPPPSPADARASLDAVDQVQADLARRLVTRWWYYPGLGLIVALLVSSVTFPPKLQGPAIVVGMLGLSVLVSAWQRASGLGVWSHKYNALTREWVIPLVVVIVVAMGVVLLVDRPLVTAATAVVVFVATVVLGRGADRALQDRLRNGARTR